MFWKISLIALLSLMACPVHADYMNRRNIVEECRQDGSFDSVCYAYLAAYRDLMSFLIASTEDERVRALCLVSPDLSTDSVIQGIVDADETLTGRVGDLILGEFCN